MAEDIYTDGAPHGGANIDADALAAFFEGGDLPGHVPHGAAGTNVLVLCTGAETARCRPLVDIIGAVLPSRAFLIYRDDSPGLRVDFPQPGGAARARHIEHSRCVRIGVPESGIKALLSLLRGGFATGASTYLVASEINMDDTLFRSLLPIADTLIFDSNARTLLARAAELFPGRDLKVIDAEWLRLAPWRELVRSCFERFNFQLLRNELKSASVKVMGPSEEAARPTAFLAGGWIVTQLNFNTVSADEGGCVCRAHDGRYFTIRYTYGGPCADEPELALLGRIVFQFGKDDVLGETDVLFERGKMLESYFRGIEEFRISRPIEDESMTGLLQKYFTIGESVINYRDALRFAAEFERAECGLTTEKPNNGR